jgi:hypothetical protein
MKFSLLSWNVEAFDGATAQLKKVAEHIGDLDPDVFGLFEVENVNIIDLITNRLPDYDYHLTDGPENKEILVGVRRGKFQQSVFTQKREFKVFNPFLRPGALLSAKIDNQFYSILFLHTDSGTEAPDFGNRNEMFEKIWSLKKALDKGAPGGQSKVIVLGDLNTMGLLFPTKRKSDLRVSEEQEIQALADFAKKRNMSFLSKEFDLTFNNLKLTSNLDHVLASDNIVFNQLGQRQADNNPFVVRVTGWQQLSGQARKDFIKNVSDHCSLYCEIQ